MQTKSLPESAPSSAEQIMRDALTAISTSFPDHESEEIAREALRQATSEAGCKAPAADDAHLRWAIAALDLVQNALKNEGHKETDDPTTCYTPLWNLRVAIVSIEQEISARSATNGQEEK